MNVVALICARGGSKGLPDKNIRPLGGLPLICWSVQRAREVARVSRVIVSTDSMEIAAIAKEAGAEVPFMRPAELAQDNSPEWLVWRHALEQLQSDSSATIDALLVVPPTAPLRATDDLERCLDEFALGLADVVITVSPAHRNPYFNMVKKCDDGNVRPVIEMDGSISRRQDAPEVLDMTTVAYVARPGYVQAQRGLFSGTVRSVTVPLERAVDIDTLHDFELAQWLLERNRG